MSDDKETTAEEYMRQLEACKTEVGQQIEALRAELNDHQHVVTSMREDWEQFIIDFKEMFTIFRSAKGFFRVLSWLGIAVKWIALTGAAIAAVWIFAKTGHWPGIGK